MAKRPFHRPSHRAGFAELFAALRQSWGLFVAAGVFGVFVNLLMLTGPLYMLQVYDRVLGSRSVATLVALTGLVVFLYAIHALLDFARGRLMARVGARFQSRLDRRVFDAVIRKSAAGGQRDTASNLADLEAVQRLLASPALLAFADLVWSPFFLIGVFVFHLWLGLLAMFGGGCLILIAILNQATTSAPLHQVANAASRTQALAVQLREEAQAVLSLGMRDAVFRRWEIGRKATLGAQMQAADRSGALGAVSKALRLLLQSAMLGLGALLVLRGDVSAGAMIASSILLGRALAPVEQVIAQWSVIERGHSGWRALAALLSEIPVEPRRTALPRPAARLRLDQVTIVPPGWPTATLHRLSFSIEPGTALGVIGPSGAGKSTLAHALTGVWRPVGGHIRLDGATFDQYPREILGSYIGYLPQRVQLFDGTTAENIAGLSTELDDAEIVKAAKKADAHEMILALPQGYDTPLTMAGGQPSGGQVQRIGLARALYGNPVLVVLDEPNSSLDNAGTIALNKAVRMLKKAGCAVIIMAHRPAAIQECDLLLMLEGGIRSAFGPRDSVLRTKAVNAGSLVAADPPPAGHAPAWHPPAPYPGALF